MLPQVRSRLPLSCIPHLKDKPHNSAGIDGRFARTPVTMKSQHCERWHRDANAGYQSPFRNERHGIWVSDIAGGGVQRPFGAPGAVITVASVRDCRKGLAFRPLPTKGALYRGPDEVRQRRALTRPGSMELREARSSSVWTPHLDKYLATPRNEGKTMDMTKSTIKKSCEEFRPLMMPQRSAPTHKAPLKHRKPNHVKSC
jgi:hypothetical protein